MKKHPINILAEPTGNTGIRDVIDTRNLRYRVPRGVFWVYRCILNEVTTRKLPLAIVVNNASPNELRGNYFSIDLVDSLGEAICHFAFWRNAGLKKNNWIVLDMGLLIFPLMLQAEERRVAKERIIKCIDMLQG